MPEEDKILIDTPIKNKEADRLGRVDHAKYFANYITKHDVSSGLVVGLFGTWGSGKTSFINLTQGFLKENSSGIIEFNPWMYSGTSQLVHGFFSEVSKYIRHLEDLDKSDNSDSLLIKTSELIDKYRHKINWEVALNLASYSADAAMLLTGSVPVVHLSSQAAKKAAPLFRKRRLKTVTKNDVPDDVNELKKSIDLELAKLDKPLIVILDDVDRLYDREIIEVFRLVRLTASFPNVIYIIACDRFRVEQAFDNINISGRDYLEKIIQIYFNLPQISRRMLRIRVMADISDAAPKIKDLNKSNDKRWVKVFDEIIFPLIRNMRDAYRYRSAVSGAIIHLLDRVNIVDVLALEAIRLFMPDSYSTIANNVKSFSVTYNERSYIEARFTPLNDEMMAISPNDNEMDRRRTDEINEILSGFERLDRDGEVANAIVKNLFPSPFLGDSDFTGYFKRSSLEVKWFKECRVAHEYLLLHYLDRTESPDLSNAHYAKVALSHMDNNKGFVDYLDRFSAKEWSEIILCLRYYESDFELYHVTPGVTGLWNSLDKVLTYPVDKNDHILFNVKIITHMLINIVSDYNVYRYISEIYDNIISLSSKFELFRIVGHDPKVGHKHINLDEAVQLERQLRSEIVKAREEDDRLFGWNRDEIYSYLGRLDNE